MKKPLYVKTVEYDRITRDYAAFLDGNIVGYYNTRHEAETALSKTVIEYLRRHPEESLAGTDLPLTIRHPAGQMPPNYRSKEKSQSVKPVPWPKRANEFHAVTMTHAQQAMDVLASLREQVISENEMEFIPMILQVETLVRKIDRAGLIAKQGVLDA